MSLDQNIRYAAPSVTDTNNPEHLYNFIKPGRWLTSVIGVPPDSLGEIYDEVVNDVGVLYVKNTSGHWDAVVNFSTVVVPADPLVLNSIHVNEIQTDNTGTLQVNLQATDLFQVGPSVDLAAVQIQSNGVISSSAAAGTSSLFLGNGAGNQLSLDPSILTISGSPDINLFASNNAVLTANAGSITAQCGTTIDVSAPSGMTVATFGSGTFFNDGGGTILKVLPNSIDMNGAGNLDVASDNILNLTGGTGMTLTTTAGQITMNPAAGAVIIQPAALVIDTLFSGTTISIAATTGLTETGSTASISSTVGNVTLNSAADINMIAAATITSSAPFYSGAGTAGAPTYSFSGDSNSGIFSAAADVVGISAGGTSRLQASTTALSPVTNNVYDLGSAGVAYRDVYGVNAYTTTSDARLKEDVEALDSNYGLKMVEKLSPVSFRFKQRTDERKRLGFLAQQVEQAVNDCGLVSDDVDLVVKGEDKYMMKYDALISVLVKSVQELSNEVKELKSKV